MKITVLPAKSTKKHVGQIFQIGLLQKLWRSSMSAIPYRRIRRSIRWPEDIKRNPTDLALKTCPEADVQQDIVGANRVPGRAVFSLLYPSKP